MYHILSESNTDACSGSSNAILLLSRRLNYYQGTNVTTSFAFQVVCVNDHWQLHEFFYDATPSQAALAAAVAA